MQAGGNCACGGQDIEQRAPLPAGQLEDDREEASLPTERQDPPVPMPAMLGERHIALRQYPRFPPSDGSPMQPYCASHQWGNGQDGTAICCNRQILKWATIKDGTHVPLQ